MALLIYNPDDVSRRRQVPASEHARARYREPTHTGKFPMNIRFLTPTLHGIVDYMAAAGLLTMPFILGVGSTAPLARWLAVGAGVALVIDSLAAVGFALAPFFLGFHGLDAWYYWSNSAAVFLVVGLSPARNSDEVPATAH